MCVRQCSLLAHTHKIVNQIVDVKMRNVVVSVLLQYAYLNVKQISNLNCFGFVLVMAFEFQNQLRMLSLRNMRYSCSNHFQHNQLNLLLFSIVSVFLFRSNECQSNNRPKFIFKELCALCLVSAPENHHFYCCSMSNFHYAKTPRLQMVLLLSSPSNMEFYSNLM